MNNLLSVALATNSYIPNLERSAVQMYYTDRTFAVVSFLGQVLMVFLILCCIKYFVGNYFKKEENQAAKVVKTPTKDMSTKEIKVVEKTPVVTTEEEIAKKEVVNESQDIVDDEEIPDNIISMKKEKDKNIEEDNKIVVGELPKSAPIVKTTINEDFDEERWLEEVQQFVL